MKKHEYIKNYAGFSKSSLSDLLVSKQRTKWKKTHCFIFKIVEMGNFQNSPKFRVFSKNSLSVHIRQKCILTKCVFFLHFTPYDNVWGL